RVFDGASRPLLLHLVEQGNLDERERRALRQLIDRLEDGLVPGGVVGGVVGGVGEGIEQSQTGPPYRIAGSMKPPQKS
ncbi:MAG: hypothetical protein HYZ58_06710, partial [Acidobacteria bacterium]|nr:hypothetical protein [Acidobacteriota bacterium]